MLEEEVPTELKVLLTLTGTLTSLLKHTTEDPAPAALVECVSLRCFILSCEYLISLNQIHAHTCYQSHRGNVSQNPKRLSNFPKRLSDFFNGFLIASTAFQFSSTAFCFPRNPRKSIYGKKYTKDHYLSFVFFVTRSPTCAPSFVIPTTIPNTLLWCTCVPNSAPYQKFKLKYNPSRI